MDAFDLVNLLDRWPGKKGKGDAFPLDEARASARRLNLWGKPLVILVGRNVARAFGANSVAYLEGFLLGYVNAVVIPHPSGLNRWWNDPANTERARRFMRSLLEVPGTTRLFSSSHEH